MIKVGHQQEKPGEAFFAGVEEVMHKICRHANVPGVKIGEKTFRRLRVPIEECHHCALRYSKDCAPLNCTGRVHAEWRECKTALAKETSLEQDGYDGFLAMCAHNRELHLAALDEEHSIPYVALREDGFIRLVPVCLITTGTKRAGHSKLPLDFSALDGPQRYLRAKWDAANESGEPQNVELRVSAREMVRQDNCTVCGEAEKDDAQDCVSEAEEDRVDAVGNETDNGGERGKPEHQAGACHQGSPPRGSFAQDRIGKGEPTGGDASPVKHA